MKFESRILQESVDFVNILLFIWNYLFGLDE